MSAAVRDPADSGGLSRNRRPTTGANRPPAAAAQIDRWENEGGTVGVSSRDQPGLRRAHWGPVFDGPGRFSPTGTASTATGFILAQGHARTGTWRLEGF